MKTTTLIRKTRIILCLKVLPRYSGGAFVPTLPMVPGVRLPQLHCEYVIIICFDMFCIVLCLVLVER